MTRFFCSTLLLCGLMASTLPDPGRAGGAGVGAGGLAPADSLPSRTVRDTIRAGEWKITGDVQKPLAAQGHVNTAEKDELKKTLTQLGSREVPGLKQWQRKKVPKVALFSSAALPGLGQLYNGRRIKVGLAAGLFTVYMGGAWFHWRDAQSWTAYRDNLLDAGVPEGDSNIRLSNQQIEFHKESSRDFLWWSAAVWIINVLDAWIDAHLFDLRVFTPPADIGGSSRSPALAPQSAGKPINYVTYTLEF